MSKLQMNLTRCYRCAYVLRSSAHRIHSEYFCSSCYYNMTAEVKHMYELQLEPMDLDLYRKELNKE